MDKIVTMKQRAYNALKKKRAKDNYKINIQQHLDIVNALLSKEFAKAKEYLKSHLKNSQEVICKAIKNGKLCKI